MSPTRLVFLWGAVAPPFEGKVLSCSDTQQLSGCGPGNRFPECLDVGKDTEKVAKKTGHGVKKGPRGRPRSRKGREEDRRGGEVGGNACGAFLAVERQPQIRSRRAYPAAHRRRTRVVPCVISIPAAEPNCMSPKPFQAAEPRPAAS